MAKYCGKIGYSLGDKEVRQGVWEPVIDERTIFGDLIRNTKQTENSGQVNDNVKINNQMGFIADPFAVENFSRIKYATYMGTKLAVSSVEIAFPRLILNLGGIYNDQE